MPKFISEKQTQGHTYKTDFITDKGSRRLNEDAFVANIQTNTFAVFDGASSLTPFTDKDGKTGAFLASNIAKSIFDKDNKDLVAMIHAANSKIREEMLNAQVDVTDKVNLWGTAVAAVKIKKDSFDWVQISDSLILVIYTDGTHKLLVEDYDHDQEMLTEMKKLSEKGVEDPRAALAKQVEQLRRQSNVTYGLVSGDTEIKFLHSGTESLDNVKTILLFSDGLLIPKADPNQSDDMDTIVREYKKGGLRGWLNYVRDMERDDPKLRKYMRYKQYDDATAVSISF